MSEVAEHTPGIRATDAGDYVCSCTCGWHMRSIFALDRIEIRRAHDEEAPR